MLCELTTVALLSEPVKVCSAFQAWPFQCTAREAAPPPVKAHALPAEMALAATTLSPDLCGKETLVQVVPLRL